VAVPAVKGADGGDAPGQRAGAEAVRPFCAGQGGEKGEDVLGRGGERLRALPPAPQRKGCPVCGVELPRLGGVRGGGRFGRRAGGAVLGESQVPVRGQAVIPPRWLTVRNERAAPPRSP